MYFKIEQSGASLDKTKTWTHDAQKLIGSSMYLGVALIGPK